MRCNSVSILIVSWNGKTLLESCLASVLPQMKSCRLPVELWIWDNGSTDGTVPWLSKEVPEAHVVASPRNVGFSPAINELAERASGDILLLLNNDATVGPHWLESFIENFNTSPSDVVGIAGLILNPSGTHLDFGKGILTFDGHAFQLDFGRPLSQARLPEHGEELLFACGGNCLLERKSFLEAGGFDPSYFAYLEDVDFGFRIWTEGKRILAGSHNTAAYHRSMTSSDLLGRFRRGFLFERNALSTIFKNFDAKSRQSLLPAVLLTYLSRLESLATMEHPSGILVRNPPIPEGGPSGPKNKAPFLERVIVRWKKDGFHGLARALGDRLCLARKRRKGVELGPQGLAHFQALASVLASLDRLEGLRQLVDRRRVRSDHEIFSRFPLAIVPTYPGDEELFSRSAFRALLPSDLPCFYAPLAEIMAWPLGTDA